MKIEIFETKGNEDHHITQQPNASNMTNLLQPIVIDTVSEVKVVYGSTKTLIIGKTQH